MSLNAAEIRQTSQQFLANFERSGLTTQEVCDDLGFTPERLQSCLRLESLTDPADGWYLRDYLVQAVQDAGREPVPFTVLTEPNRLRARMWFDLRRAPRHDFAA